jgi:tRNA pseudouridine55 synthase
MARAGERPELRPRSVTIHAIELVDWDGTDSDRPVAVIDVECSAGTYIRALARDLGGAVGSGAYLGALIRSASGPFRLDDAVSVDALRAAAAAGADRIRALLLPAETGLERFPRVILDPPEVAAIARGQFVRPGRPVPATEPDGHLRLVDAHDRLVAIAAWRDGRLAPEKVLVDVPARAGDD